MSRADKRSNSTLPGVNFFSPVGVVSGLGVAGRAYVASLRAARVPVRLVPVHEPFVHQESIGAVIPAERPAHPVSIVHANADTCHRFFHFHGRALARSRYRIAIWVWELPAFRDEWWSEYDRFDEIWVPSRFCHRAVQALTAKPVFVMPHAVALSPAPQRGVRRQLGIGANEFVFLYVFDASSLVQRKNPFCLVEAFRAAFPGRERVRLVLKVGNLNTDEAFGRTLDAICAEDRRVTVVGHTMAEEELAGLMLESDCYVSPHRSEGFGLTVAEAMGYGLPVIATDYGGTTDFVTPDVGFPLDYRLVEIEEDIGPYPQGGLWAEPSPVRLAELMGEVLENPAAAAAHGRRGQQRITGEYSTAAVGRQLHERLAAIGAAHDSQPDVPAGS